MESQQIGAIENNIKKLIRDVALIKEAIISKNEMEEELTDWAKNELEEARKTPDSKNVSLEEVERRILGK